MRYPCDCHRNLGTGAVPDFLAPNPDVAGIGVLVGLTLPALATFVLVLVYYFSAIDPDNLSMWTKLDVSFLKSLHLNPKGRKNAEALERIILSFSDTQLVNAFSLLLGAFTLGCSMVPYHWQIMMQCVWFTSATHLATIPILRTQISRFEPGVSRFPIYIRVTLMTFVFTMLVASLIPTGHPLWLWSSRAHPDEGYTFPALCFYDYSFLREHGPHAAHTTAFDVIFLAWSIGLAAVTFLKRLLGLLILPQKNRRTVPSLPTFRVRIRTAITFLDELMGKYVIMNFFWQASNETMQGVWRLFESFCGDIFWLFMMLSWNIFLVAYQKWLYPYFDGDNTWGFGQTTPLVLLVLPAMTIIEEYFAKKNLPDQEMLAMNLQWTETVIGNGFDVPAHIPLFLLSEALIIFAILAGLTVHTTNPSLAVSNAGTDFFLPVIGCLLAAPLVFNHIVRLARIIFKAMKLRETYGRNMCMDLIVGVFILFNILFFSLLRSFDYDLERSKLLEPRR